jgi:putative ribosome biogenesis GTPase RsgA
LGAETGARPDTAHHGDARPGRVVAGFGRHVLVETPDGARHRCLIAGRRLRVVCGDRVDWRPAAHQGDGLVVARHERDNELARPDRRGRSETIAANVTQLVVVASPLPLPDPFILDRYLAAAELMGADACLVWNKIDVEAGRSANPAPGAGPKTDDRAGLEPAMERDGDAGTRTTGDGAADSAAEGLGEEADGPGGDAAAGVAAEAGAGGAGYGRGLDLGEFARAGYPVLRVSAKTGAGLDALRRRLEGHANILVGQSGVGKSSLLNALLPDVAAETAEISAATGEGRHTTTASILYHLPDGGELVDSPGVRDYAPPPVAPTEAARGYREFGPLLGQCRFANCMHLREPGCAIKAAVDEGRISQRRYESYRRLVRLMEKLTARR